MSCCSIWKARLDIHGSRARYATWEDFVKSETERGCGLWAKGAGDWAKLRDHSSYHTDTLADRIMP